MKCSVENCHNDTQTTTKSHGITFHLFPKEPILRASWMDALNLTSCESTEPSVVCSEHFRKEDFYERSGLRMIKKGALPVRIVESEEDLDVLAALRVCRICLAMDSTMSDIRDRQLDRQYEQITGIFCGIEDGLPQRVCWECDHRLRSAVAFRNKAIRAHGILAEMLQSTSYITVRDIKTVNRIKHNLKSSLVKNNLPKQNVNATPIKIIKCESHKENNDNECGNDYVDNDNRDDDNEGEPPENIVKVEIKDEKTEDMFYEEYLEDSESEDDKKLSEIYPNVMEKRRDNTKRKVEKKVVKKKEGNCTRGRNQKKDGVKLLEKRRTNEIKRRKLDEPLENFFIRTSPSYDEQIAEIEKRQDKMSFRNAIFKCTVCYKGFNVKGDYDIHVVKHSEQSGAYECFICKTRFKTSRLLWKHQAGLHMEKFTCKKCPFVTRSRDVARKHAKWHAGTKYECPHCPTTFDKFTTYMNHVRIKHATGFVCGLCGFTFVSQRGIEVHKNKTHKLHDFNSELSGPYCELCEVKFVSEEAHSRHLKLSARHSSEHDPNRIRNDSRKIRGQQSGKVRQTHERRPSIHPRGGVGGAPAPCAGGDKELISCEQCGVQLKNFRRYVSHFKEAHPDKNRTKYPAMQTSCMCEQCGKIFPSVATLKDHFSWAHTGEKRYKCAHCPKSYTQKPGLVLHEQRVHSASRPSYECELCGKHFAYYCNMRRHMVIHAGLKPHKCEACGKCFTTVREMRSHFDHVHLKKPWPRRTGRHRGAGLVNTDY